MTQEFMNAVHRLHRVKLDCTIVTAADKGYFVALQALLTSIRLSHDCDIIVFDLGLTHKQQAWVRMQGARLQKPRRLSVPVNQFMWQTWNKPHYIKEANTRRPLLWIDADCIVTGSLAWLDNQIKQQLVIFTDKAAIHFNGFNEGVKSVTNSEDLYWKYPTVQRFAPGEQPNAGVIGLKLNRIKDQRLLDMWMSLIDEAMSDPGLLNKRAKNHEEQAQVKWYDQGALQWAMESLRLCDYVVSDQRYNDPTAIVNVTSWKDFIHKLNAVRATRIAHFPCGLKPYEHFPKDFSPSLTFPEQRDDLTLLVLGHKNRMRFAEKHIRYVHLPDIIQDNALAESRVFLSLHISACKTDYVGLCTAQWNKKYEQECLPIGKLHHLPMGLSQVWAGRLSSPYWLKETEKDHPGMKKILMWLADRLGIRNLKRSVPWSNNLIAHHSVLNGLQSWWWRCRSEVAGHFGLAPKYGMRGFDKTRVESYLVERYTMLYFCMRDDLHIRQIPNVDSLK